MFCVSEEEVSLLDAFLHALLLEVIVAGEEWIFFIHQVLEFVVELVLNASTLFLVQLIGLHLHVVLLSLIPFVLHRVQWPPVVPVPVE